MKPFASDYEILPLHPWNAETRWRILRVPRSGPKIEIGRFGSTHEAVGYLINNGLVDPMDIGKAA